MGDGVFLEDVDLVDLARELAGRPAWLVTEAGLRAAFGAGGTRTVPVAWLGAPALLRLAADAGWWAAAASVHELALAAAAGFEPARCAVIARVKDDGLVMDAITRGVAVLAVADDEDARNVARIAELLDLPVPAATGAPPAPPTDAFARCAGLLARVLRADGDEVWIDAPLPASTEDARGAGPSGRATAGRAPAGDAAEDAHGVGRVLVLPVTGAAVDDGFRDGLVCGLSRGATDAPMTARVAGRPARGDALLLVLADGIAARSVGVVHPEPEVVLVRGALWRPLEGRSAPEPRPSAE